MSAEVICISSDDDELETQDSESAKSYDVKEEQYKSVGRSKDGTTTDLSKRKESSDSDGPLRKRLKPLAIDSSSSENSPERCVERENIVLLKPSLVVKEKRSVSPVDQHPFSMFISLCLQKDRADDMQNIVNKLKRTFERLDQDYVKSRAFKDFLDEKRLVMTNDKKNKYIYILDVISEMKDRIHGESSLLLKSENSESADEEEDEDTQKRNSKIARIDNAMRKCEKYIKKLEAAEVDFDDEDDSTYIKLERYKRRIVELYTARCRLIGESSDAGRSYLRPRRLKPTGIAEIDQAITKFVNTKICKRNKLKNAGTAVDAFIFPNYSDILECIHNCNEERSLGFNSSKLENIAKTAFTQLGEHLQRVRRNDYWDTFSLYLENQEDPAATDAALAAKLAESHREGQKRLANILQKYVDEQEKRNVEVEEEEEEEGEESEESSAEAFEDEDSESEAGQEKAESRNGETADKPNSESIDSLEANKTATIEESVNQDSSPVEIKEASEASKRNSEVVMETIEEETGISIRNATVDPTKRSTPDNVTSCDTSVLSAVPLRSPKALTVSRGGSEDENTPDGEIDGLLNPIRVEVEAEDIEEKTSEVSEESELTACEKGDEESENEEDAGATEGKPLLRLRSFARPPTTWNDGEQKRDKSPELAKTTNSRKVDVVDLTQISPAKPVVTGERVNKPICIVKGINNNDLMSGKKIKILKASNVTVLNQVLGTNGSTVRLANSLAGAKVINVIASRNPQQQTFARKRIQPQNLTVLHPTTSSARTK